MSAASDQFLSTEETINYCHGILTEVVSIIKLEVLPFLEKKIYITNCEIAVALL